MSTAELRTENQPCQKEARSWTRFQNTYECRVLLCPEEGGFSVHALTLPGAVSQGDNEAEALVNIREAIQAAIGEYKERGITIPWEPVVVDDIPKGASERWILVNA
jgi:predicted RNase H-like HicB family nuclease